MCNSFICNPTFYPFGCRLTTSDGIKRMSPPQIFSDFAAIWPSSASKCIIILSGFDFQLHCGLIIRSLLFEFCSEAESLGLDDFPTAERLQWHGHAPGMPDWSESSRFVAFTLVLFYISLCAFNNEIKPVKVLKHEIIRCSQVLQINLTKFWIMMWWI